MRPASPIAKTRGRDLALKIPRSRRVNYLRCLLLIVGILVISTMPLFAQAQPDPAKLTADARKVVGIIGGDKAKVQTYCQIANVGEQMNQAVQAKDKKKFDELARKLPVLEKNLGPEYLALIESLGKANLTPKDGREIVSMFDTLDDSCPH